MKWFLDWLQTPEGRITVTIIVLTAVMTVIVGMVIPSLGRLLLKFLRYVCRLPKRGWRMLKNWYYWMRYHPNYGIVDKGKIRIEKKGTTYKITLPITLWCENRDDLGILSLNCESLKVKIKPRKIKGRKQTYYLKYDTGEKSWSIHPLRKLEKADYILAAWNPIEPTLSETAKCQVQNIGIATLKGITKNLKIKQSFDVDVIWEGNNTSG